jgi:hypothetical protein
VCVLVPVHPLAAGRPGEEETRAPRLALASLALSLALSGTPDGMFHVSAPRRAQLFRQLVCHRVGPSESARALVADG